MPAPASARRPRHTAGAAAALLRVLAHGRRWAAVLALSVAASTTATLLLPAVLGRAVDRALGGGTAAALPPAAVLLVLTAAETLAQYAGPRASADATARLREETVRHTLAGDAMPVHRPPVGELTARLTGSAPQAALAAPALVYSAAQLLMAAAAVAALAVLAPPAALAFAVTAPLGYLAVRRQLRRTARLGEGYQRAQAAVATRLLDAVSGSRSIAASATLPQEIERVLQPVPELSRQGTAMWDSQRSIAFAAALLAPATQLAVLAASGAAVASGSLGVGGMLTALGYAGIGLGGFGAAQSLLDVARAGSGAVLLADTLAAPVPRRGHRPLPEGSGRLELKQVTVRAGQATLLDRVDLDLPAGSWTAVVGAHDKETSALAAVAAALLTPDRGTALLDGVPPGTVRPEDLRTAVACAFADPVLHGPTVEEAIVLGAPPTARHRSRDAAVAARADTFVRRLPEGYRTPTTAAPLSGGERQRLGLARAFARESRLLILDDATSSLDSATEAAVLKALRAQHGRTRLTVTRRPAAAALADTVAWLEHGRIRALAPHRELWSHPDYRAVFTGTD
ncbi:ATP-binding cassette domain-containing protein [Streptomyces sp. NRRL B-24484]|uniref:ATP-binding cassette domain-containing protein n=1 Tax=Streptomyces sp. NRRL B-24484 TaxID=1463833 RepID=UPI001F455B2B|nr:ABC transporter ATP-binding protein [Streptomyces sp. NRRL B-24484]